MWTGCYSKITLFECLDAILPTWIVVVNHSFLTGEFSLICKTAIVQPLLKKTSLDSEDLKNYRPFSNLSFMSKVLEKVMLSQILQHIHCNKLLSDFQSACCPYHSTETALWKWQMIYSLQWMMTRSQCCASGYICSIWHYWSLSS